MILADKIINLRKKAGWSQEDLAAEMGVSRQSVSKWEGAQSIPEMDKILKLSVIFGVSTDYLLKDDFEEEDSVYVNVESDPNLRKVSLEDAQRYIGITKEVSKKIAFGIVLFILSPVMLFLFDKDVLGKVMNYNIQSFETVSIIILLLMIASGVGILIINGMKTNEFEFLEKEDFETLYGVDGMVKERKQEMQSKHYTKIVISVMLFILSATPILLLQNTGAIIITLCMVSLGVFILVDSSMNYGILDKLLKVGDYTKETKESNKIVGVIASFYWPVVVAIFLWQGFMYNNWSDIWVIWPIAGVLFGAIAGAISTFKRK